MSLDGYFSVEFEIRSPVEKFCQGYMEVAKPRNDKVSSDVREVLPSGKRKTQLRMEGFQISEWFRSLAKPLAYSTSDMAKSRNPDYYTKLEGTITVIHTEGIEGGRAIWTLQYEKISSDIKDTLFIIDITTIYFKQIDERIFSNL
ncbi:unnamed protein product [Arabidopsis lyrata]|uniref:Bet v I/Major latex protein domain-containing protein n=1 Tax=Arabidopsis lyrata subsp. lyrata TaxID=81972 RepID=D7KPP8_ARALL|nr:uncharacterized protein At1g24010 [Arabidopsis lyrata subsp. lyrata]EFH69637.1 hypothetical protein ARALYDRAFT_890044 [Arabidopsis lyrata subsp. lyrata]CAH8253473.1 unnamed protein product [Arabidopsis lyrata]|eukprot:XP_002893378.1 uncharacterized protein At1g24010 [Arabidopsis lyrata subsp. lyrata]